MRSRSFIIGLLFVGASLVGPGVATSYAADAHHTSADHVSRACTKTSSGKCIRGGQFCPKAKYNKSGYDVKGRRYVCKGNRTHPHWMKP